MKSSYPGLQMEIWPNILLKILKFSNFTQITAEASDGTAVNETSLYQQDVVQRTNVKNGQNSSAVTRCIAETEKIMNLQDFT